MDPIFILKYQYSFVAFLSTSVLKQLSQEYIAALDYWHIALSVIGLALVAYYIKKKFFSKNPIDKAIKKLQKRWGKAERRKQQLKIANTVLDEQLKVSKRIRTAVKIKVRENIEFSVQLENAYTNIIELCKEKIAVLERQKEEAAVLSLLGEKIESDYFLNQWIRKIAYGLGIARNDAIVLRKHLNKVEKRRGKINAKVGHPTEQEITDLLAQLTPEQRKEANSLRPFWKNRPSRRVMLDNVRAELIKIRKEEGFAI